MQVVAPYFSVTDVGTAEFCGPNDSSAAAFLYLDVTTVYLPSPEVCTATPQSIPVLSARAPADAYLSSTSAEETSLSSDTATRGETALTHASELELDAP